MKYSHNEIKNCKNFNGIAIKEYQDESNPFPIDACTAEFDNGSYPWKKNSGFYEMFFVLSGEVKVEFEDGRIETIKKNDVCVIEPNVYHQTSAKKAKLFIVCNPPFNIKNVIFKDKK